MNQLLYDIAQLDKNPEYTPDNSYLIEAVSRLVDNDNTPLWKFIKEQNANYREYIKNFTIPQLGALRETILKIRHTPAYKVLDMFNVKSLI